MPGPDFLLLGVNKKASSFTHTIAEFKDGQLVLRTLLARAPFSLPVAQAASYSLHGFRHVYSTAMRQLRFRAEDIEDAGHWTRGSAMTRVYDAEDCVAELSAKEQVRSAVALGWRRVQAACLPNPSPVTPCLQVVAPGSPQALVSPSVPLASASTSSTSSTSPSSDCISAPSSKPISPPPLPDNSPTAGPVFVIQHTRQLLHIWAVRTRSGAPASFTLCRRWRCGTPGAPVRTATFSSNLDKKHFDICEACFSYS